jgi:hypothetical protein
MCNPKVDELSMMTYLSQFPNAKLKPDAPLRPRTNRNKVRVYGPGKTPKRRKIYSPGFQLFVRLPHLGFRLANKNYKRIYRRMLCCNKMFHDISISRPNYFWFNNLQVLNRRGITLAFLPISLLKRSVLDVAI